MITRNWAFVAASLVAAALPAAARAQGLEGKSFEVEVFEGKKPAFKDKLSFKNGGLDSVECKKFGFSPSQYTASGPAFTAVLKGGDGSMSWSGKLVGDRIEGTAEWNKSGKITHYTFTGKPAASLYDRLGGTYAIAPLVDEFIERLAANDLLNKNPKIKEARDRVPKAGLKYRVTALVAQVTGGPEKYAGRNMKDAHAHLAISEAEWNEMARVFKGVCDEFKVPKAEQDELFAIIGSVKSEVVTRK
jgi:hemoglobin